LGRLSKLPIAVQHLQETGIGKTVNGMRKTEGQVGDEARNLVNKLKDMVAAEDEKSETENEEEAAAQERDVEPEPEEAANSYDQEELGRHSKHLKKNKKDDGSRKEHNHSRESPQKEEKSKKKEVDTAVPSTSGKSKSSNKSSHRSQSPPSEKSSKNKHKSSSEKSSKESKKDKESSSKVSGSKKQHHDSDDSTRNQSDEEADSGVISFAQALGGIGSSKKKKSKDKDREKVKERHKQSEERKPSLSELVPQNSLPSSFTSISRHHPTSIDIRSSDYEISPNYKPLPQKYSIDPLPDRNQKKVSVEEALGAALASKGVRTKVFSGKATSGLTYVPKLFDFCIRVLQENIDSLEYTGGVPYDLLKPVLERATAQQLYSLENFNPYLLEDTGELWKQLCQKECKTAVRNYDETWRDVYLRCHEEREKKLKSLTANIQKSIAKATPVRTTKLAYVESVAKGPRGSARAQAHNGLLNSLTNAKSSKRPFEASSQRGSDSSEAAAVAEVVKLPASAAPRQSNNAPAAKKPKVAPLMQKTLKFIKNRYRR